MISQDQDHSRMYHRKIRQAEIISTEEKETSREEMDTKKEEDDEALEEERRRRIKEKALRREQEEAAAAAALLPLEEEEEEEEEESEYEAEGFFSLVVKPVFVPTSQRDTIAERERLQEEEKNLEELVRMRLEERKIETKQMVEEIRKDLDIQEEEEYVSDIGADVDTDDEVDEAQEYEAWKTRETGRIKRKREEAGRLKERRKKINKKARYMTTEEEEEDEERKKPTSRLPVLREQKWKFMQKYYHKGAFFQSDLDDDHHAGSSEYAIFLRDFSAPTGEDKMDKSMLPKVMQVKHFGRRGRTKWTHLLNEDTTHA